MATLTPFHLAIPVNNLVEARAFYGGVLGCPEGRSAKRWVDFNLYGHQLVCHLIDEEQRPPAINPVDGHRVPVPHFGVVLDMHDWNRLAERLRAIPIRFVIDPHVRFKNQPGEQATMFLMDPSHNALEFKAFRDIDSQLFAT